MAGKERVMPVLRVDSFGSGKIQAFWGLAALLDVKKKEKGKRNLERQKSCANRESNPGQTDGNHLFYH